MRSTFCIVEDRPGWELPVKLLVLSLNAYASDVAINLFCPTAGQAFLEWAEGFPRVSVRTDKLRLSGWDVKPEAALILLEEGFDEVIWLDSDIVACCDPYGPFRLLPVETFALTIDSAAAQRNGTAASRARSWGLDPKRELPFNPNLAVFRATSFHHRLLERWTELLSHDEYQACQQMAWYSRPFHMVGDHDPLAALLSSEFSDVPVRFLPRGEVIVHYDGLFGYTTAERIRHLLFGPPVFAHSMGNKPWSYAWGEAHSGIRGWVREMYFDVSPYTVHAAKLGEEFDLHQPWMNPHHALSRALWGMGLGSPPLVGLPLAALADIARLLWSVPGVRQLTQDPSHKWTNG